MPIYDIVMLVIFFGSVIFGYRKGLAWQIASLAAIIVSYFVAINFRGPVAQLISVEAPWNQFAAMLLLFLGTSLIIWTVYASFNKSIKKMEMKGFDRQAGAILGGFKGAILCMLVTVFAVSLFQSTRNMVHNSASGHYVVSGINQFSRFTPAELAQFLDPHVQSFQENIGGVPEKRPLFGDGTFVNNTDATNQQSNTRPFSQTGFGQANGNFNPSNQNQYQGQFNSANAQNMPPQQNSNWSQPNSNGQTPYPPNPNYGNVNSNDGRWSPPQPNGQNRNVQTQNVRPRNGGGFWQGSNASNGQATTGQTQSGQFQPRSTVRTGQNGWPEINTTINTKELLQRGASTTADMLRRAYESSNQPR